VKDTSIKEGELMLLEYVSNHWLMHTQILHPPMTMTIRLSLVLIPMVVVAY
jgi:hypothetical protein